MASFDFTSFVIGLLLGMIVMLLIVWIAYYTRSFIFTYCPTQARACSGADYYNNPGDAIANGANVDEILFLNDKDYMFYKRVPKNGDCVPEANQVVPIRYPQYCFFGSTGGVGMTGKSIHFGSDVYTIDGAAKPIITDGNCHPVPGQVFDVGTPLLQWDAAPIPL